MKSIRLVKTGARTGGSVILRNPALGPKSMKVILPVPPIMIRGTVAIRTGIRTGEARSVTEEITRMAES